MPTHDDPTAQVFADTYTALLEGAPEPPAFDDIAGVNLVLSPPRRKARWEIAIAVGVATLLAGVVPVLLRGGTPSTDTLDPTRATVPTETMVEPPTTSPAPSPTPSVEGFAPRLEGSGVDVTFGVTPVEMEISGDTFVVMEADWHIDWVGMAWEWGDDEVRQQIAAGNEGNQTQWEAATGTLVVQQNADKPTGEDLIARFSLIYSGASNDFEVQALDESSGQVLATVTGSLPGLDVDQILTRVAFNRSWAPSHAAWLFAPDNGELIPLDPPWEPFWGYGDQFFEIGDMTLALFLTDHGWNLWSTTDGYAWEDLGEPAWPDLVDGESPFVHEDRLYEHGWTRDAQGYMLDLEFWTSSDGVEWVEVTQAEYEAATGLAVSTDNPDDAPPPPDPWFPPDFDRAAIDAHFDDLAQNAVVISEDPLILQLLPGSEPRFDTSLLGEEIPFEPLTSGDPRVEWLVQMIAEGAQDPGPQPDGPALFVGHVTDQAMALPYDDMGRGALWSMRFAADCRFECLGIEGLQAAGELSGDIWLDHNDGEVEVLVSGNAAVVVLRYNSEAALWQRPTGGWAIFPSSVDGDATFWVDAYDADGNLIATTETR